MAEQPEDQTPAGETQQASDMSAVRRLMIEQLQALRTAPAGDSLAQELKRAKGVSELSATIIDSARVEVEYLQVIHGDGEVPFLKQPEEGAPRLPAPQKTPLDGLPSPDRPWRGTVHKLKG